MFIACHCCYSIYAHYESVKVYRTFADESEQCPSTIKLSAMGMPYCGRGLTDPHIVIPVTVIPVTPGSVNRNDMRVIGMTLK